jgi:hypothetical protein
MRKLIRQFTITALFVIPVGISGAEARQGPSQQAKKHIGNVKYNDLRAKQDISVTKPVDKSSPSMSKSKGR